MASSLVGAAARLAAGIWLARELGVSGRGEVAIAFATLEFLRHLLPLGLHESSIFISSSCDGIPSNFLWFQVRRYLSRALPVALLLVVLSVPAGIGPAGLTPLVLVGACLGGLAHVLAGLVMGSGHAHVVFLAQGTASVAYALAAIGFALSDMLSTRSAVVAWVLGLLLEVAILHLLALKLRHYAVPSQSTLTAGLRTEAGARFNGALHFGSNRLDVVLLGIAGGSAAAGLYAVAQSANQHVNQFGNVAAAFALRERRTPYEVIGRWQRRSIPLACISAALSLVLIGPVFGQDFLPARLPAVVLALAAPSLVGALVAMQLCIRRGASRGAVRANIAGLLVNSGVVLLFSASFGATAAAVGSLLGYSLRFSIARRHVGRHMEGSMRDERRDLAD